MGSVPIFFFSDGDCYRAHTKYGQKRIQEGGPRGPCPPGLVKKVMKKMAAEHGGLYFMFLNPPPSEVSGTTTDDEVNIFTVSVLLTPRSGGGGDGKAHKLNFAQNVDRKSF